MNNNTIKENDKIVMQTIAEYYNTHNSKDLEELKSKINKCWELYKTFKILSYDLLFNVNYYFEDNKDKLILDNATQNVELDLKNLTIYITDLAESKSIFIECNKTGISDVLYDFISCYYFCDSFDLDLNELTEKYKLETGLDFSGF